MLGVPLGVPFSSYASSGGEVSVEMGSNLMNEGTRGEDLAGLSAAN